MLVAKEWVLTAAHCVKEGDFPAFEIGAICHDETDYSSNGNCEQPSQVINTLETIRHPDYNSFSQDNDFALVKLASSASATPVDMDLGGVVNTYNSNSPLWAIGFGNQSPSFGGYYPGRLQHVEVSFVPQSTCNSNYSGGITSNMFCAADPGQDSCQGDSGGPIYDANNNVLVGVVSWGNGCAQTGFPGK
jgi:Secreted trypsin-like serine protease